jgi:hypothetical protein
MCGVQFQPQPTVAVVDEDDVPLGYLCERCFMLGPHVASQIIRHRTDRLHAFAEQARFHLQTEQWLTMTHAIQERIAQWEELADRIEQLGWWMLSPSHAGEKDDA